MFLGDSVISIMNSILWAIATVMIMYSSIYFTFQLHFVQFQFKEMFYNLFHKQNEKGGISPIQSLMMTLGARIGIGSIAGVALAIYLGGVGTIFWMWVAAILATTASFAETVLGITFRTKDKDGLYIGGPFFYIRDGLKKRRLGNLYAILILVSYIGGFVGIQANTITKSVTHLVSIDPMVVAILICVVVALIIWGGIRTIVNVTSHLVPIMTVFYLLIAVYVMVQNITMLPSIFFSILTDAFSMKSIFGGFLGTMVIGVQRGIFSNEAGLGTGCIASSAASCDRSASQGYIQMLGIYITTLIFCTATAMIVLTSNYTELVLEDVNGIEIVQYAFQYHLGNVGSILIFVSILLFSFSTILTGYYDGETSLKYLFRKVRNVHLNILKIASLIVLFVGSVISSTFLWDFVDILVAILAILNIYAILHMRKIVKDELDFYKQGKV